MRDQCGFQEFAVNRNWELNDRFTVESSGCGDAAFVVCFSAVALPMSFLCRLGGLRVQPAMTSIPTQCDRLPQLGEHPSQSKLSAGPDACNSSSQTRECELLMQAEGLAAGIAAWRQVLSLKRHGTLAA